MRRLSYTLEKAFAHNTLIHPIAFEEELMLIQRELLSACHNEESRMTRAFCLGALIYTKSLTRPISVLPRSSGVLVQQLQASLGTITPRVAPLLLLWLFCMGGIASPLGTVKRTWFMGKLANVANTLLGHLPEWIAVRQALRKISWIDEIHDGPGRSLWNEVKPSELSNRQCPL